LALYNFYFLVCAYIVVKPYVVVVVVDVYDHADAKFSGIKLPTYGLATIY